MAIAIGDPLPAVPLVASDGARFALSERAGAPIVVYFYPKDDTAGCTREAQDFSALRPAFDAANVVLLGISRDPAARHLRFIDKHGLKVPLASDETGAACEAFGVWTQKSMYGRSYMGIERATFLFDAEGRLRQMWRKVRVPGHAEQVLAAARSLSR